MIPRKLRKEVAAAVVLMATAVWTAPVWAQLVVSDPPVEQATGDMDINELPQLIQQDTTTATSLSMGGGGGNYIPNAQVISNLDQALFPNNGANIQDFLGWQSCAPDCTDSEKAIDEAVMATYQGAFSVAQQQEQELINEGDTAGTIDANIAATTGVLTALQGIADLLAMQVQEQRYQRQQLDTIITLLATHYSQDLNDGMMSLATTAATEPGQQQ